MIDCQKAQVEFRGGQQQCRCVHTEADTFKQIVSEDICSACPLRIARSYRKPTQEVIIGLSNYDDLPETKHGGQLWLENGQFVEKVGDEHSFLLGDWIETRLKSIGVTKEKWVEVKSEVGLAPSCDCDERKEWLNQIGTKFGDAVKNNFSKLWS